VVKVLWLKWKDCSRWFRSRLAKARSFSLRCVQISKCPRDCLRRARQIARLAAEVAGDVAALVVITAAQAKPRLALPVQQETAFVSSLSGTPEGKRTVTGDGALLSGFWK